jgi:hypothetical protein
MYKEGMLSKVKNLDQGVHYLLRCHINENDIWHHHVKRAFW